MRISKKQRQHRRVMIIVAAVVLLCIAGGIYWLSTSNQNTSDQDGLSADAPGSANIDAAAEERVQNGGGSGQGQESVAGGVSDGGGKGVVDQPGGVSSQSGNITLYSPAAGTSISGSVTVKGAASTPTVYYRINDDVHGMIGNGRLSVHDGHFSGKLSVSTDAKKGSFEVYTFDSQGRETNNISVEVTYR